MKKNLPFLFSGILLLLLSACLKDKAHHTFTYRLYRPVYSTSAEVRANVKSAAPKDINASGKIYIKGNYIFLSELGRGIHVINNSNPANPVNESFIEIPGCTDMAAADNLLYADCFTDLLTIDISDPTNVKLKSFVHNVFPDRQFVMGYQVQDGNVIVDWIEKDTTITETIQLNRLKDGMIFMSSLDANSPFLAFSSNSSSTGGSVKQVGVGGSMARFAITHNNLYAVTANSLQVLSLDQPVQPLWKKTLQLPWGIETIYPFKDKLFIGSNSGMFIVNINNPLNPELAGSFSHARVCDPVIADDSYAYVTLRSGSTCGGFTNQMDVLNVSNINSPALIKTYPLTNPRGLSKDGNLLFVCEGPGNVKVFNAANPNAITEINKIDINESFDVICFNKIALITAKDGLYQYSYNSNGQTTLLSKLGIVK